METTLRALVHHAARLPLTRLPTCTIKISESMQGTLRDHDGWLYRPVTKIRGPRSSLHLEDGLNGSI